MIGSEVRTISRGGLQQGEFLQRVSCHRKQSCVFLADCKWVTVAFDGSIENCVGIKTSDICTLFYIFIGHLLRCAKGGGRIFGVGVSLSSA